MSSTKKRWETYKTEEYKNCSGTSQGRYCDEENIHYKHSGYGPSSHFQENDRNTAMRDTHGDLPIKGTSPRRVTLHDEDHIRITVWKSKIPTNREIENRPVWRTGKPQKRETEEKGRLCRDRKSPKRKGAENRPVWRERKPPKKKVEENEQEESFGSWFKVTIPCGRKYDRIWLLDSIQSQCSVPFTPVDFHCIEMQVQFFVQDINAASAIKNISYKIHDEKNQKICIFVRPSTAPYSVRYKLTPEQMEQLKLTMNKRYDVFKQALDLQSLRYDPDLVGYDIDMILNRRNCMAATLKIIEENFCELLSLNLRNNKLYQLDGLSDIIALDPKVKILNLSNNELKSVWELDKIKWLKLEELWLEGNPLCNNFSNQSAYVSAVLQCFPKLRCLDGQQLSLPRTVETEAPETMKTCKESYKGPEALKNLIWQFLQQYYLIYDYGDRRSLLAAYHDEACFSLTIPFNAEDRDPISLEMYSKLSRNMKRCKDPVLRDQLLKHTKRDVVDFISILPRTQHDFNSFVVDVCVQTEKMLCFSVSGVFKEGERMCQPHLLAFTRFFIATPGRNSSLCIVNDQLCVRDISRMETQGAWSTPVPTPSSSCIPTLSREQWEMIQAFSTQSKMNLEWSYRCLEDNEWNYTRAQQIFTMLQAEGKIPEEAFKQSL